MTDSRILDCHVHSTNSGDAEDSVIAMCSRAIELCISEIVFAEHVDFEPTDPTYGGFDFARYMDDIAAAREKFGDRLVIKAGVECDYQERYRADLEDFLSGKEFDCVLGGAHYAENLLLEIHHQNYFPGRSEREAYRAYFETVRAAVNSGMFDTIAHLDLCKRYGCLYYGEFRPSKYEDILGQILQDVIKFDLALEVNTSGLRQAPGETYPGPEMLAMYARLGGRKISVGSDAHRLSDLGAGLDEALRIAASEGLIQVGLEESAGAYIPMARRNAGCEKR